MPKCPHARGSRSAFGLMLATVVLISGCQSFSPARDAALERPPPAPIDAAIAEPALVPKPRIVLEALPEAPPDLLSRLRGSFTLPASDEEIVQRERASYARDSAYLARVFERGGRYLHYIAEELERRGMPADFALLPIVESEFDPFAYSHGRASGLWQIIPGTGKQLGLKQNWWFDGRRDVIESTRAALDYLQMLHTKFDGDWLLAVAGYNSGEGNVRRALRRAEAAGQPKNFWGVRRYLPAETRTYVPRLLAIRDLVADPAAHALTLPEIADAPYFAVVETGGQIDMTLAAELVGLEVDRLYELNAGINRWATDPDGPHRLLVPVAHADAMAGALGSMSDRDRVRWTRHHIRQGESLGQLARKYHTTAAVLREINGLRGNLIRAGDYLLIPHAHADMAAYSQSVAARAARNASRPRSGQRHTHVVAAGESLWTISRRYDVGTRELAAWNAMAPGDVLRAGRELVVWTDAAAPSVQTVAAQSVTAQPPAAQPVGTQPAAVQPAAAQPAAATQPAARPVTAAPTTAQARVQRVDYVVRRGDSLYSIASRFRVTIGKLVEWNALSAQKYLQPGQRLVIHVDVTEQST